MSKDLVKKSNEEPNDIVARETYKTVRDYVVEAQTQVNKAVNFAMVTAYWNIGKKIYEVCGESDRAAYGKPLLMYLAEKLSGEFGKGYDESNLRKMRKFYIVFPIQDALRPELSWTHYRRVEEGDKSR